MANWLSNYRNPNDGGFGLVLYEKAIRDGFTPSQIAAAFPDSGLTHMKEKARNRLAQDLGGLAARASQADSYQQQLKGYQDQFNAYQNQLNMLTGQYNTALAQASDWEQRFSQKSSEYEAARAEADRYQEEAVGRQLAGLRSGTTQAGGDYIARGADITSGQTAYRPGQEDSAINIEKNISATDSVLARKGPVVQMMRTAPQVRQAPQGAPQGGTGSYYASRFA